MKLLRIVSIIMCLFATQLAKAQGQEMDTLTKAYLGIKNALVADDGKMTSQRAGDFLKALEAVSKSALNNAQQKSWEEHVAKLKSAGEGIAKTVDVSKQREQLNELSTSLFAVLKVFKTTEDVVYYQYCPMKKAYWLSTESVIENPYYGKRMLNCGSVKETLEK